ncbi:RNC [Hepatospora eriocheir]|uniref:RNC n=1 Tax=Hepatospora eriocheir TaxID=1081669 RepID=A0A1X0QJC0_9MICR|nr:RNC [Hepatospora eriocheir]
MFWEFNFVSQSRSTDIFLGDRIIKYVFVVFLVLEACESNYDVDTEDYNFSVFKKIIKSVEKVRCYYASNQVSYELCVCNNLYEYILPNFSMNSFKLPNLESKLENFTLIESIKEVHLNSFKKVNDNLIETLTSIFYHLGGIRKVMEFFYKIRYFKLDYLKYKDKYSLPSNVKFITNGFPFKNYFKDVEYVNILKESSIRKVESIIGYTFKNKGLIENALVHTSYSNLVNSEIFEVLEYIRDSTIGLVVCDIESEYSKDLYVLEPNYVNNENLGKLVRNTGLYDYYLIEENIDFKSKHYGDVCEAIFGAIITDLDFNISEFIRVIKLKIYSNFN